MSGLPLITWERPSFLHGHVRRRQPCMTCGQPTRRTVPHRSCPPWRHVLCSRCELPSPEARLLMAIVGVRTLPELEPAFQQACEREAAHQAAELEAER
jgi:hypothetical protein